MEKEMEIFIEAAEQLQALKAVLTEQQGSSVRLRSLAETLEQVAVQVSKIPGGLSVVVARAEAVEQRLVAATTKVDALRDGIPAVIERIEKSDVGKSVDSLSKEIAGSRDELKSFRESISEMDTVVEQVRHGNEAVLSAIAIEVERTTAAQEKTHSYLDSLREELLARLGGMESGIVRTEEWSAKSVGATGKAFEVIATALKSTGERQAAAMQGFHSQIEGIKSQDLAGIRQQLTAISGLVREQGVVLDAIAKKKGFSF